MPQPKTLSSEALEGFNALIEESDKFRDWNSPEIQVLVQTAESLQKAEAREAFVWLGSLAAICGDIDNLYEYFRKALLHPDQPATKAEYWSALANAALYKKAHEIGRWLLEPKRGFFPSIWERAVSAGYILEVSNRLADATRTYPELSSADVSALESAATLMSQRGLCDDDVVSILDLMGRIQREHRIMFSGKLVSTLKVMRPPEDPPYLYITIQLRAGVDEIHGMNRKLARLVVQELTGGAYPQGIVASFVKSHSIELRAAA